MPFGEYPYTIDDKGRVIIPPAFRDFLDDGMVLTRGMEGCLYVFPSAEWKRIEEALIDLPLNDNSGRAWVRFFYSGASKVRLDNQGRASVPNTLRTFANLESEVMIAGAPKRLEVWNTDRWTASIAEIQAMPPAQDTLPEPLRRLVG